MVKNYLDALLAYVVVSSGINILITLFIVNEYANPLIQHSIIDWALTIFLVNICCILVIREYTKSKINALIIKDKEISKDHKIYKTLKHTE